ncbi:MAG TPA: hypothetical protein VHQ47_08805 [Phycisphaerae bacterium]|nr:hypothetical protein [Phycisphaerae bacterium]
MTALAFLTIFVFGLILAAFIGAAWMDKRHTDAALADAEKHRQETDRRLGAAERNIVKIYSKVKTMATEAQLDTAIADLTTAVNNKLGNPINDSAVTALNNLTTSLGGTLTPPQSPGSGITAEPNAQPQAAQ